MHRLKTETPAQIFNWLKQRPLLVIILFTALLYLPGLNSLFYFQGGDNANYMLLARALADGRGYSDTLVLPSGPHTKYPFFYPLMLAGVFKIFGENMLLIKLLNVGFIMLMGIACHGLVLRRDGPGLALPAGLLAVSWILVHDLSNHVLSDIAFAGLAMACLWVFPEPGQNRYRLRLIACALLLVLSYFTRTAGLALFAALIAATLFGLPLRGHLRAKLIQALLLVVIFVMAAAPWALRNYRVAQAQGFSYVQEFMQVDPTKVESEPLDFGSLGWRVLDNSRSYLKNMSFNYIGGINLLPDTGCYVVAAFFWAAMLAGLILSLRSPGIMEYFLVFYIGLILLWPFNSQRFSLPLFPIMGFYLLLGARTAALKIPGLSVKAGKVLVIALLLLPLIANIIGDIRLLRSNFHERKIEERREVNPYFMIAAPSLGMYYIMRMYVYIESQAEQDQVILSRKPSLCALLTGHPCIRVPRETDSEQIMNFIEKWDVDYLVVDAYYPESAKYLSSAIAANEQNFVMIYRIPQTNNRVFKVLR